MKKIFSLFVIAAIIASCGGEKDPKTQLAELKAKQAEIADQIKQLEKEIAAADTTAGNSKSKDVIVTAITSSVFTHYLDVQGIVDADENVTIMPTMAGNVTKLYVNEGDVVKAGQLLAEVDNDIYVKQLNSVQPQLALATEVFNRQQRLWNQKIGSEVQYLQAKTQKESLEKQIETLQEQIELTRIKSPISGTVDNVALKIGQMAAPGMPAMRVVNLSKLKVKANISEAHAAKVKKGNDVSIFFPDQNKEIASKVTFAAKVIDPMTRTFVTEASISSDAAELRPNMIAILKVADYKNDNAIVIPVNLIQNSEKESFVFVGVEEGGKKIARKKVVTVGSVYNGNAEILSGLAVNDKLITTGATDLADGLEIKF